MRAVVREDDCTRIVFAGEQGPPGTAGPPGPAGAAVYTAVATSTISGHKLVVLDNAGSPQYASNLDPSHMGKVLGLTLNGANPGNTVTVQRVGDIVEPTWVWVLGQPVYLGLAGALTQIVPTAPAFLQVIGFPIAATKLFVDLREPFSLI